MTPTISVIVPVYNVEDYLEKCVNSILNQTYSNFELILIDDGSKDESGRLCDILATRDNRIVTVHKKNGGLSSARNAGLKVCKGDYITFVDSDDMIAPNALELMLKHAEEHNAEVVVSEKITPFNDNNLLPKEAAVANHKIYDGISATKEILCKNTRWEAWGHLFKSSLWNNTRFPEGLLYEDLATTPFVFSRANKVCIIDTSIYYYFLRPGSIMRPTEIRVSTDLYKVAHNLINYFKSNAPDEYKANICGGVLMELCSRVDLASRAPANNHEFIVNSRKLLRGNTILMLQSDYYSVKQKAYYLLESFGLHGLVQTLHNRISKEN